MIPVAQFVADISSKLLIAALRRQFPNPQLSETAIINNGQGLKTEDRDTTGECDVYSSSGLVGVHSESMHRGPFVVIGRKGSAGKVTFAPRGGWVTDTAYFATPLRARELQCKFLFYALKSLDFSGDIITTAIPGINRTAIYSFTIPLPPPEVQTSVVEFLDALAVGKPGRDLPKLPSSLAEQRRVAARIEELTAQIHEARTLRHEATEETEALLRSILTHDENAKPTPMRELVKLRPPDVTVRADEIYQFAGVYCFGRGVFKSVRKSGMDFAYPRLTRLRAGEFVYPKLMAWEGALGVVPPECDGCVVSTEFPVFEVHEDRVLHEVLDTYFRTPSVWPEIAGESTGTNIRRRRLNPQDFLDYKMPLPSMETQMTLRKVKAEVDALKRLQAETAAELDALLPAILDKAFKGEL